MSMGIELPFPHGEHANQSGNVETGYDGRRYEAQSNLQSVETFATEAPASQEVRSGHGVGDGNDPVVQSAVANATVSTPLQGFAQPVSLDDVPVIAADEDLIEKQWVDSVKRIIKDTRSDPFMQGQAISRLQADYLQKRYGKSLPVEDGAR